MRSMMRSGGSGAMPRAMAASGRRAPAKRKPSGKTGRRTQRRRQPARSSRLARWAMSIRDGVFSAWPFAIIAGALFGGALFYGLAAGGYFSAAGAGVVGAVHQSLGTIGFTVQQVTVTGRNRTSSDAVMTALGVERGDPILAVDVEAARFRLERLDWVQSATVKRLLPDTIHVELVERRPFAIWQRGGRLSVIDRQGGVITEAGLEGFSHLPFVVGHGAARHAGALIEVLERQPEFFARVRAAVRVANRRWNLRLENGVDVRLPEVGAAEALRDLAALDSAHRILSRDIQAIDLRLSDRLSIKLTPEAAQRRDAAMGAGKQDRRRAGGET